MFCVDSDYSLHQSTAPDIDPKNFLAIHLDVPVDASFSLDLQVFSADTENPADIVGETAIIIVKDTPIAETDFVESEQRNDTGEFRYLCSKEVGIDMSNFTCKHRWYEMCLLQRETDLQASFSDYVNNDNSSYEVPALWLQQPVKIYHKFNTLRSTRIEVFGKNNNTRNVRLFVGIVSNTAIDRCGAGSKEVKEDYDSRKVKKLEMNVSSSVFHCYHWSNGEDKWSEEGCKVNNNVTWH